MVATEREAFRMTHAKARLGRWYKYHKEDYQAVQDRLAACRNVMLRGRMDSAARMLRLSTINAVLSIQTQRERHERAFTAYCAGMRLDRAAQQTVYGVQKAEWLEQSLGSFDFEECVRILRDDGHRSALSNIVDNFKGLSWVKGGFALAMCGIWELACPDTRVRQVLDIEGRCRTVHDYYQHLDKIDQAVGHDAPLFIKQWALYDFKAQEHARHMAFFREVLEPWL